MSMNLQAKTKSGEEIYLWQTPTWVTDCCLYNHKGKQRKWKDTRLLYAEWVRSRTQGVFLDVEEAQNLRDSVKEHLDELYSYKKLKFYVV